MAETPYLAVLKRFRGEKVKNHYPVLRRNDLEQLRGNPDLGDLVRLISDEGEFVGWAYYNPACQTVLRVLTTRDEPIDLEFFRSRLRQALERRERLYLPSNVRRLVHGAADGLPGLSIDQLDSHLLIQVETAFMHRRQEELLRVIGELLQPASISYRTPDRPVEGLTEAHEILQGHLPKKLRVQENGLSFTLDPADLHTPAFYPDERDFRQKAAESTQPGERVLDLFAGLGAWSSYFLRAGAKVTAVEPDSRIYRKNRAILKDAPEGNLRRVNAPVLDYLIELKDEGEKFDLILIHPPFQTREQNEYKKVKGWFWYLIYHALPLLNPYGKMVITTRARYLSTDSLLQTIHQAAAGWQQRIYLREIRFQPGDYPYLVQYPESLYLKSVTVQI